LVNAILNFFSDIFSNFSWLAVLLVAMLPIAEAKVAIPFGMSQEVWGSGALSPVAAGVIAFVGSMLPALIIIPFLKPIFAKLKQTKTFHKAVVFLEKNFKRKADKQTHRMQVQLQKLDEKNTSQLDGKVLTMSTNGKKLVKSKPENQNKLKLTQMLTLLFFVAIPLPLAGVWTSSAIAAFGQMKFWPSLLSIAIGNLFEVVFVTVLCVLFIDSIELLLLVSLVLISLYVVLMVVLNKRGKAKQQK